jgi:hypothetical protein
MAKSNQPKSAKPAAKAEEAAPAVKKETKPVAAAAKPAAAAKAAAPKVKKADKPAATTGGKPVFDTSLAAQNAAKLLVNRNMLQGKAGGDKPNSAGFRQMKESLAKPSAPSVAFLHESGNQKKSNQPFGVQKQVGHNQTFGADVNRAGVPRRTGGG